MKAILMSIRPEWVAKILNGEKTIEIRKMFPKDYVGWVYIYCTKDKKIFLRDFRDKKKWAAYWRFVAMGNDPSNVGELPPILNGKVVARFWCDKVEDVKLDYKYDYIYNVVAKQWFYTQSLEDYELYEKSCLTSHEIYKYLNCYGGNKCKGYATHITEVKPFDKPKEISEFMKTLDNFNGLDCFRCSKRHNCSFNRDKKCEKLKLTRAPRNGWCYVEVE